MSTSSSTTYSQKKYDIPNDHASKLKRSGSRILVLSIKKFIDDSTTAPTRKQIADEFGISVAKVSALLRSHAAIEVEQAHGFRFTRPVASTPTPWGQYVETTLLGDLADDRPGLLGGTVIANRVGISNLVAVKRSIVIARENETDPRIIALLDSYIAGVDLTLDVADNLETALAAAF